jgi:excisionase family DNA binding protein
MPRVERGDSRSPFYVDVPECCRFACDVRGRSPCRPNRVGGAGSHARAAGRQRGCDICRCGGCPSGGAALQLTSRTSGLDESLRAFVREVVREELAGRAETSIDRDRYLATAEAAQLASVAEGTIRRWVRDGRVTGHRAGRVLRVRLSDMHRLLAGGGRTPRDGAKLSPEELARRHFGVHAG